MVVVLLAGFGHAQLASRALEQAHTQALFESSNLRADRRLGDAQASRGSREAAGLHDLHEHGDGIHLQHRSSVRLCNKRTGGRIVATLTWRRGPGAIVEPGGRFLAHSTSMDERRMSPMSDARRYSPSAARNREPILEVRARVLPASGLVLEVASGSGEHAAFFGARLPHLIFQPTDPDARNRASIAAWRDHAALDNLRPP